MFTRCFVLIKQRYRDFWLRYFSTFFKKSPNREFYATKEPMSFLLLNFRRMLIPYNFLSLFWEIVSFQIYLWRNGIIISIQFISCIFRFSLILALWSCLQIDSYYIFDPFFHNQNKKLKKESERFWRFSKYFQNFKFKDKNFVFLESKGFKKFIKMSSEKSPGLPALPNYLTSERVQMSPFETPKRAKTKELSVFKHPPEANSIGVLYY